MFRTMQDFFEAYRALTEGTRKILAALTDDNLEQAVAPGHRKLGELAWHVVASVAEMANRTGLELASVDAESMPPTSAGDIAAAYDTVTQELVRKLEAAWSDETLSQSDDMYGESWQRGKTLHVLIVHETHHVGQMTVLLRQAGSKVPGICGPSKEEWGQFGMEPPAY